MRTPYLYTVRGVVGKQEDELNVTVGFRDTLWTGNTGLLLNGHHLKFRGFSHHNSFGGLGVALPARVNLFKAQASKSVGANVWRMSHNPYVNSLYDILDRTGKSLHDSCGRHCLSATPTAPHIDPYSALRHPRPHRQHDLGKRLL